MNFPANVTRQCEDLTQLMGVVCMPYLHWPDRPHQQSQYDFTLRAVFSADSDAALHAIGTAASNHEETVVGISESQSVFAVPLGTDLSGKWYAVGRLAMPKCDIAQSMVRIAGEACRRKSEIENQTRAIEQAEMELSRAFDERLWLRQLNSQRANNKKLVGNQSRHALESLKTLMQAEAVAIFVYSDREDESHGIESMVTGKSVWSNDDIKLLLQKVAKPRIGEATVLNNQSIRLHHGVMHSCVVVPIGEIEILGYVLAINRRRRNVSSEPISQRNDFSSSDADLMHEVAAFVVTDGHGNVLIQESEQLVLGTLRAMSNAIEARDPYTHGHSERVARVGYEIAVQLQLSEAACQEVYLAGVLHDIGKIGIPDNVLLKAGKLTAEEFAVIQKHPEIGHRIIEDLGKLKFALPGVLSHHERYDGKGYPHRLQGERIPLMSRILAVSDAFDAMTSSRVYRSAMLKDHAIEILKDGAGSQWDPDAVNACLTYLSGNLETCGVGADQSEANADWNKVSQAISILKL